MTHSTSGRVSLPYLRAWRNARFLTIRALAKAARVGPMTISELEHGRRQANFATVGRLAKALALTPHQLTYAPPPAPIGAAGPEQEQQTD
ncbi:MAG TPA: helix-turn-helix transcriptional regulator [Ktedonobacterales bacterium]|nr:helix-turn-helix transcriptional regulator [Ktedonobacterales bacterium]